MTKISFISTVLAESRKKTKKYKQENWMDRYAKEMAVDTVNLPKLSDSAAGVGLKKEIINPAIIKNLEMESELMAEREAEAQKEAKKRTKRIGLAYSKGNYTYLGSNTSKQVLKDLGKKTSEL